MGFGDKLKAGVGLGYLNSDIDFSNSLVPKAESNLFQIGGYGTYTLNDKWYVDGMWQVGTAKNEHKRYIYQSGTCYNSTIPYVITGEFDSEYRSFYTSAYLETGYDFDLGNGFEIAPFISLDCVYLSNESFVEKSESVLALNVDKSDYDSIRSGMGLSLSRQIPLGKVGALFPEISLMWQHEFSDTNRTIKTSFDGQENSDFVSTSGAKDTDSFLVNTELLLKTTDVFLLNLQYEAEFSSDKSSNQISINCNIKY